MNAVQTIAANGAYLRGRTGRIRLKILHNAKVFAQKTADWMNMSDSVIP